MPDKNELRIKRGSGTPPSLSEGELAFDLQNKVLFVGDGTSNLPRVEATKVYISNTGSLGTGYYRIATINLATATRRNVAFRITGSTASGTKTMAIIWVPLEYRTDINSISPTVMALTNHTYNSDTTAENGMVLRNVRVSIDTTNHYAYIDINVYKTTTVTLVVEPLWNSDWVFYEGTFTSKDPSVPSTRSDVYMSNGLRVNYIYANDSFTSSYSFNGIYSGSLAVHPTSSYWVRLGTVSIPYNASYLKEKSLHLKLNVREVSVRNISDISSWDDFDINLKILLPAHANSTEFQNAVPQIKVEVSGKTTLSPETDIAALVTANSTSSKTISLYVRSKSSDVIYLQNAIVGRFGFSFNASYSLTTDFYYTYSVAFSSTLPTPVQGSVTYGSWVKYNISQFPDGGNWNLTSDLNIGNILYIDKANNRVGINKSPNTTLDIDGNLQLYTNPIVGNPRSITIQGDPPSLILNKINASSLTISKGSTAASIEESSGTLMLKVNSGGANERTLTLTSSSVYPSPNSTLDLGTSSYYWNNLYISRILALSGSASAPSISFSSSPNTGLYLPSSNTIGISAGGNSIITISGSSVSIGTNTSISTDSTSGSALEVTTANIQPSVRLYKDTFLTSANTSSFIEIYSANSNRLATDIYITENRVGLDAIYLYKSATYYDLTAVLQDPMINSTQLMSTTSDYLYLGSSETFNNIYVSLTTNGSGYTLSWSYWNGSTWASFTPTQDGTSNFSQSGWVRWSISGWAPTTIGPDTTPRYYIRVRTTTTPTTVASADSINVGYTYVNFLHGVANKRSRFVADSLGRLTLRPVGGAYSISVYREEPRQSISSGVSYYYVSERVIDGTTVLYSNIAKNSLDTILFYLYDPEDLTYYFYDKTSLREYSSTSQANLISRTNEYIYLGKSSTFSEVYFGITTAGSGYSLVVEYSSGVDGSGNVNQWSTLTVANNTSNFSTSGWIWWSIPNNWVSGKVNNIDRYWIRIRTTTTPSTVASCSFINTGAFFGRLLNFDVHGYNKFYVDYRGNLTSGRIYPGSGNIGSSTQNTNYISGTSSGIGINTTSPSYTLDVTGRIRSTQDAYFATSSGNVGIGTTNPSSKLTVAGDIRTTGQIVSTYSAGAPFSVNSSTLVTNLNADYIDGLHATELIGGSGLYIRPPVIGYTVLNMALCSSPTIQTGFPYNTLYLVPFVSSRNFTLTQLGVYGSSNTDVTAYLGIYSTVVSNNIHYPNSLLASCTVTISPISALYINNLSSSVNIQKGRIYWLAFVVSSSYSPNIAVFGPSQVLSVMGFGSGASLLNGIMSLSVNSQTTLPSTLGTSYSYSIVTSLAPAFYSTITNIE